MTIKQKIYDHYLAVLNQKIKALQNVLADLKDSGSNETKSTAGDKHETALAMLQIEQANVGAQLNDLLQKKAVMEKINPGFSSPSIINGSLVKTDHGYFFISIASGRAVIEGVTVTALSSQSPLGGSLMGLYAGSTAHLNNKSYVIETVY